ncbi:MAG TPA: FIST N-terminal domain-containing protein [Polyangium sp.]|nr:FIST N-terminal domain-containing protein [Polyangium sp.]
MNGVRSARATQADSAEAAKELVAGLSGADARLVVFFAGITHDGGTIGRALVERFPGAHVVGCSSNGEFCDVGYGKGGAVAIAIGGDRIGKCVAAMADVGGDIDAGIRAAAEFMATQLGQTLSDLSPDKYAGLVLLEGARGREEKINEALGNVAPFLPFVGGSAGDDITFSGTWTFVDGKLEKDGTALVVMEMLVPFVVMKTCHFEATERTVKVTRVDASRRLILELEGKPAAPYYAEALGVDPAALAFPHFLANPLGLMIDGEPWLRSGVRVQGDALLFACAVVEGSRLHFMRANDMVADTQAKFDKSREALGGSVGGAIFFNCAYRMIEASMNGTDEAYHRVLSTVAHVGLHSNGESYIGHINQTLTGLMFA